MPSSAAPILIVEDEPSDAEDLKQLIRETGISNPIQVASTGAEAIEYLSGTGEYADRDRFPYPAFLFLDLILPAESGLDVLRWIQERPKPEHQSLGIVVLTGLRNMAQIRLAYQLGAHSFMMKPVSVNDFMSLLRTAKGIRVDIGADGARLHFRLERSERGEACSE